MTTAPFSADVVSLLSESHRHVLRVTAVGADFTMPLDVEDFSIDWDSEHSPRVDCSFTSPVPDWDALGQLDPRAGVRVEVEVGYGLPGGSEDVQRIADLGLRTVTVDRPSNTIRCTAASDEMLVMDGSPAIGFPVTGATHAAAMRTLINHCIHPAPKATVTVSGGAVTVDPVTDRWGTVRDLADRMDARVFDDGLRIWHIDPTPTLGTPVLAVTHGEDGTLITGEAGLDREQWANYCQLRYEWVDGSDVEHRVTATAIIRDGPWRVDGPAEKRIFLDRRDVPTTQAEANVAASSLLRRFAARARTFRFQAVAAYWLRPDHTVTLTLPDMRSLDLIVKRVEFRPGDGVMTVDAQRPDSTVAVISESLGTTTPPAAPKEEDPEPPAASTYVSTWEASSSRCYKGDGSENSFVAPEIAQGYFDSTNGNQRSIVLFTASNSTGDESGVSITSALSGASIKKVEVWLYADHWYSFAGGTARLGYYNGTSLPGSFSGGSPYVSVNDWKPNTGRWVSLNHAGFIANLLDGSARGITVGPGVGSSRTYYGRFDGAGDSRPPKLRIVYSK